MQSFDLVCAVDGAWGGTTDGILGGGIGGTIKGKDGRNILTFSGPTNTSTALMTEIRAILFVITSIATRKLKYSRAVICSDSVIAVNAFNKGLLTEFPMLYQEFNSQHLIQESLFIHYVPRALNENADSLAKNGISRPTVISIWAEGY